jgi:hypothetical protein
MDIENNYDFRKRRGIIHKPQRRNYENIPAKNEISLDSNWRIGIRKKSTDCIIRAAFDLCDYLLTSMDVSVKIEYIVETIPKNTIIFEWDKSISKGYFVAVSADSVKLSAGTVYGILRAGIHLEDCMNLVSAPFIGKGSQLFAPRLVHREIHSGYGIDDYPDCELNAILHAGYDTIVVFVKGIDMTSRGYCDLNSLIRRAASFGLKTSLYNYMEAYKHPDDPDADEFYDSIFGEFFRHVHGAAAMSLCGESFEFPSKDPNTTGKTWRCSVIDGIPDTRPSPGWYPCEDYPRYLQKIEQVIHKVEPDIELSFSSYNWGYAPFEIRRDFLRRYPKNYTLRVPFENFKSRRRDDLSCPIMDYTISEPEPGYYFWSEAEEAFRNKIPVEVISNTAGATWDFGTVPYVPAPYKWIQRLRALNEALEKWEVNRYYETHHYGWEPNVITELCKRYFYNPQETDLEGLLEKIAIMDYGKKAAPGIIKVWKTWSDAMDFYVASNEDQYGPWRCGPSYPFIFHPNMTRTMAPKEIKFPSAPYAHFGGRIIKTFYQPFENIDQSPGFLRCPRELESLEKMLQLWAKGLSQLRKIVPLTSGVKREDAVRLEALGLFIHNSIITTINIKKWWRLNVRLQNCSSRNDALKIIDALEQIIHDEIANARATIPAVETDSRLGWEPSMEYVCDKWHLEWKVRQMQSTQRELADYRKIIKL